MPNGLKTNDTKTPHILCEVLVAPTQWVVFTEGPVSDSYRNKRPSKLDAWPASLVPPGTYMVQIPVGLGFGIIEFIGLALCVVWRKLEVPISTNLAAVSNMVDHSFPIPKEFHTYYTMNLGANISPTYVFNPVCFALMDT